MFCPFVAFFLSFASAFPGRGASAHPQTQAWDDPQILLNQDRRSLHRWELQTAEMGERPEISIQDRCLIRILPLKLKYKVRGNSVCVCVSLIMQCQSSLHVCTSCSNMIFFHDGMTLRLPLIWENLEHAGTSLGKRSIWKSIWVWVNVRISPFFHSRDTDCVELGDWNTVLETHK